MAQKIITDLQLIAAVVDGLSFALDDGLQTYRGTSNQIKSYILANENINLAMLNTSIFTGLGAVTPADDDYFPLVDTSDSNLTKKGLVGSFRNSVYRAVTTTDAVGVSDETMKLSGASFTSTLPTAVGVAGKRYKYVHAGTSLTQVYTIATTSAQTVGGIASGSYSLYTNGEVLVIESDGANWIIIGRVSNSGWTSFTPTGSWSTNTTYTGFWRRIGDTAEIEFGVATAGAPTSATLTINMPTNITIATAKQVANLNRDCALSGNVHDTGTQNYTMAAYVNSSTVIGPRYLGGDANPNAIAQNAPMTWANGDSLQLKISVPIAGWQP